MVKGLHMITSHSVKWILAGALIMPGLTGCSFFGGGDESEEVATSDDTLEATPEGAEEGMPAENMENAEALGAESNALGMEGMEGMDSNALNNAAIAEGAGGGLPGSEIPPELLANDPTAAANAMGMDMGSESMAPPAAAPAGEFSAAPGLLCVLVSDLAEQSGRLRPVRRLPVER
jgi:hypothetical protein